MKMTDIAPVVVTDSGRKRRKNGTKSVQVVTKTLKDAGKQYTTASGKVIPAKKPPPDEVHCKCRYSCKTLTPASKLNLFIEFYGLANNEKQSTFLMNLINITPVKRRRHGKYETAEKSRRQCSVFYAVPDGQGNIVNVCKATFAEIFAVSIKKLQVLVKKKKDGQLQYTETRGNKRKHRKFTETNERSIREHVNSFPRLESHYGRARSQKEYLSPDLNIHRLFRAYKDLNPGTSVTYKYYSTVFKRCFPNVKFGLKRTDTCATCDVLAAKMISDSSNKAIHKHHLQLHQLKAERATKQMSYDIKKSQMPSSTTCTAAMDLQQVIVTPTLTHGAMYYSRQLANYNLGLHIENTSDGYMILWNESITGRGGNEIASCIYKALGSGLTINKDNLIMWSDNCCGQNKNKMFIFLWAYLTLKKVFKTVEHKFLISGHSYLSCDRDFALIEKRKRVSNCMVPDDILHLIENARFKNPFRVIKMNAEDFYDFKSAAETFLNTTTLQISRAHHIKFDSAEPFVIRMKETHSFTENWKVVNLLKRNKTLNDIVGYTLPKLQCQSKISGEKKKDLLDMIPYLKNEDHRRYYEAILN